MSHAGRWSRGLVWPGIVALLWGAACWPGVVESAACDEAQEILLLGMSLGPSCAGVCLEQKITLYTQAVERCPQYPEAQNNLADAYEQLGQFARAETHYRQAIRLNPRFAVPYFGLGDLSLRQEKVAEAVRWYAQGLRWDPEDTLSQQRLAEAKTLLRAGSTAHGAGQALLASSHQAPSSSRQSQRLLVRVLFAPDSAVLREAAVRQVRAIGEVLKQAEAGSIFIVEGHADRRGTRRYNRRLSQRRAEAVRRYLIAQVGIAPAQLRVEAHGATTPLVWRDGTGAWAMNRRVEVVQVGKAGER